MDTLYLSTILLDASNTPGLIITILVSAVSFFAGAYILKGIEITDFVAALIVAAVVALLNATIGKIMAFLAFPITLITFGLFSLVIDAIVIMIAGYFLSSFKVKGFLWAILLAIVVSLCNSILFSLI